jgi:hypothetical protein
MRIFRGPKTLDNKERKDTFPFESLVDVQVRQLDMFLSGVVESEGF